MRKFYILIIYFSFMGLCSFAQTAASVSNGNFYNPLTWNCSCIPTSGYTVTISHSVTLDGSLAFSTGGVIINSSGSLIQDASLNRDIWINGGFFNNMGKANFRYFLVSAGTLSNTGTFTVSALTNSVSINNYGSITMDSMYVAGSFTNSAGAKIIGDSMTNASTMINNGNINVTWTTNNGTLKNYNNFTGYAHTNAATFENYDSLILSGSIWNKANFFNKPGARVNLTKNFHNYNSNTTAVFDNDGVVKAFDSWYNTDTVKGSGSYVVTDTSANSGFMKENFDFCDLTPPGSAPFVDFNSGSISSNITWCTTGIKEESLSNSISIYPNPNNGVFFIKGVKEENIIISDQLGRKVKEVRLSNTNNFSVMIDGLNNGVYFISGNNFRSKVIVTR